MIELGGVYKLFIRGAGSTTEATFIGIESSPEGNIAVWRDKFTQQFLRLPLALYGNGWKSWKG